MQFPKRARTAVLAVTAMATAASLAGCGGGSGSGADDKKVTIWSSIDQPVQDGLSKTLTAEAKKEGITIDWQKVENINQLIMQRIQANDTPDIAFIPQPGVVGDIVKRNKAIALDDVVDTAALEESMVPGTLEAGTVNDKLYGLLVSMNVKSLVLYPKKAWEKEGYEAPDSIDGLNELTEQIKSDGNTPWCMGIESDTATGWPVTDWFEDLIMRYGGPDEYKKWVKNETKFDSPVVREAAAEFEELMFTEGNVLGGRKAIASTNFGTAGNPMFDSRARLLDVQAGLLPHRLLPEVGHLGHRRQRRRLRVPARRDRRRQPRPRRWRPRHHARRLRVDQERDEDAREPRPRQRGGEVQLLHLAPQDLRPGQLPQRPDPSGRERGLRLLGVPVRRFGPDAR